MICTIFVNMYSRFTFTATCAFILVPVFKIPVIIKYKVRYDMISRAMARSIECFRVQSSIF